ncbi:hypothetical protein C0215_19735, partial [Clostridioides difficile]
KPGLGPWGPHLGKIPFKESQPLLHGHSSKSHVWAEGQRHSHLGEDEGGAQHQRGLEVGDCHHNNLIITLLLSLPE